MTNSMIPFSFIPGTKAKASEVNANFIALTQLINNNKDATNIDFEKVYENIALKADKTELINEFEITDSETNLNDYKTKGMYIFSTLYIPTNIPKEGSGSLYVSGLKDSIIYQYWISNDTNEIFIRKFAEDKWNSWESLCGEALISASGYIRLPNGILFQWGTAEGTSVTFPLAFSKRFTNVFCKTGYGPSYERSDTGIVEESLTGFKIGTGGLLYSLRWFAIGY